MCAGNQLASRQLYIMLLRLIWAFKIELSKDPAENNWGVDPLLVSVCWVTWHLLDIALNRALTRPPSHAGLDRARPVRGAAPGVQSPIRAPRAVKAGANVEFLMEGDLPTIDVACVIGSR